MMTVSNCFIHICGRENASSLPLMKEGSFFINDSRIINFIPIFEEEDDEYPNVIKLFCEGYSYPLYSDDIEYFENRLYDGEKGFKR